MRKSRYFAKTLASGVQNNEYEILADSRYSLTNLKWYLEAGSLKILLYQNSQSIFGLRARITRTIHLYMGDYQPIRLRTNFKKVPSENSERFQDVFMSLFFLAAHALGML